MRKKNDFEIMKEMFDDHEDIVVSTSYTGAVVTQHGGLVSFGLNNPHFENLKKGQYIPMMVMVNREEYLKRKNS